MTTEKQLRKDKFYENGERICPMCDAPLPAHETWLGARYRFCLTAECKAKVLAQKGHRRYVEHKQVPCGRIGCNNFVPEGVYSNNPSVLACSAACAAGPIRDAKQKVTCRCGCGVTLMRRVSEGKKEGFFASYECHGRYRLQQNISENCGMFKDLVTEYLVGPAAFRYDGAANGVATARAALVPFFGFLVRQGIPSLEAVTPKTITAYIIWSKKTKSRDVNDHLSYISVFFKWARSMGYRESGNPVVGSIHRKKQSRKLPRPYSEDEMDRTWNLLLKRGNPRLRFAAAIGEEAGLRISEVCNLRLADINVEASHCYVRTPNKGNVPRVAFFADKTRYFFEEWMRNRRARDGHSYVLHGEQGRPYSSQGLRREFNLVLCKSYRGVQVNETGFDEWEYHRLRHTMASRLAEAGADAATVMGSGGWTTFTAMEHYAKVSSEAHRTEYSEAMRRADEQKSAETAKRILSPAELLARQPKAALKRELARRSERCV